jgi:hypothetical protein
MELAFGEQRDPGGESEGIPEVAEGELPGELASAVSLRSSIQDGHKRPLKSPCEEVHDSLARSRSGGWARHDGLFRNSGAASQVQVIARLRRHGNRGHNGCFMQPCNGGPCRVWVCRSWISGGAPVRSWGRAARRVHNTVRGGPPMAVIPVATTTALETTTGRCGCGIWPAPSPRRHAVVFVFLHGDILVTRR